ncbi:MAG: beta-N-acetylhexosaminidase [Pseudomonadota bacterium]
MASTAIFGCAGPTLSPDELAFFRDVDPWGFILFDRNLVEPAQVRALTDALRDALGRDAPILIDQEGGRVARLRPPHWRAWRPVREICEEVADTLSLLEALRLRYRVIAEELRAVGIDVNCAPVLDVPQPNAHPIIGDRALGETASEIALRGRAVAEGLLAGGVAPVIKHLPGHGRALQDSHQCLPMVTATVEEMAADFLPFAALHDMAMGMTAHIVYRDLDPDRCATLSPRVIALIRERIGFDGLLMTDDLSMHALSGPMASRAEAALSAGCDIVLHCNGEMAEMQAIAGALRPLDGQAAARATRAEATRVLPEGVDVPAALARYADLTGEAAHA